MSCGAGPSRRTASAMKTRGHSRRSLGKAERRTRKLNRRAISGKERKNVKNSRRPPGKHHGKRSRASLTAAATARKHAHMSAHATASAHARATARAHARATARRDARLAHQEFLACLKKLRRSASINQKEWRPKFRGRQHGRNWRGRGGINPIFR